LTARKSKLTWLATIDKISRKGTIMKTIRLSLALAVSLALFSPAKSSAAEVPKAGAKAPLVSGIDQDGKPWKLADYIGRQPVILYFYPKDNTPGCTKEACGLRDRMGDLKQQGVVVVGVSLDSPESHKKFIADHQLNFSLVADPEGKIIDTYGARMTDKPLARRVSFLIGKDGRIRHVTDDPKAEIHLEEMQAAAAKLKK
jgi:peroxiredoxin Q/BCP